MTAPQPYSDPGKGQPYPSQPDFGAPQPPPYDPSQQPYGAPQQPYGAPQQPPYGGQQPPYDPSQQPYGAQQQPYGVPQQPPYDPSQQPYGGQQQPYGAPQQPYGAAQPYGVPGQAPVSPSDARTWAMLAHVGGIVLGFLAPLIVWIMYKDRDEFVRRHAVNALNFQILYTICIMVSAVLMVVLIGLLLFPVVWIAGLIFMILAGVAANKGQEYKYPINIPILK